MPTRALAVPPVLRMLLRLLFSPGIKTHPPRVATYLHTVIACLSGCITAPFHAHACRLLIEPAQPLLRADPARRSQAQDGITSQASMVRPNLDLTAFPLPCLPCERTLSPPYTDRERHPHCGGGTSAPKTAVHDILQFTSPVKTHVARKDPQAGKAPDCTVCEGILQTISCLHFIP